MGDEPRAMGRRQAVQGIVLALGAGLGLAQAGEPPKGGQRPGPSPYDAPPLPKNEEEKKILAILAELEPQRGPMLSVPREDGRLLRVLTEVAGAKQVVEVGTSNGYSGLWFCLALRTTGGRLTTHDIDPAKVKLANDNFRRAGVEQIATVVEGDAHQKIAEIKDPIDIAFVDADKPGYLDYVTKFIPMIRPGGLFVAHNAKIPPAEPAFIRAITTNPDIETIFLNMHAMGVAVTLKKR